MPAGLVLGSLTASRLVELDGAVRLSTAPTIAGNGYSVAIEFKSGFPFAQIFAPKDKEFIAIEPMAAVTNALCSGEGLRVIAPGEQFIASFRIQVYHLA